GAPVSGMRDITVSLFDGADGGAPRCTTVASATTVTAGEFRVPLPDTCVLAVRATPELWAEVQVNGIAMRPRSRLGAVPYAVESRRAGEASGSLAAQITMLQARIAQLENPDCPSGYTRDMSVMDYVVCYRGTTVRDDVVKV